MRSLAHARECRAGGGAENARSQPNFKNRTLYHGDNLEFLRGMNSGTVNLIATDPPFNKNKDFHATPDSLAAGAKFEDRWRWATDVHEEWVDAIQDNWPKVYEVIDAARHASGDDMGAFLCWLGVRLLEMHRILADDGSLYLHIDHTAHAWVKCLMDAIFGRDNFRNEIVWCYTGPSNTTRWFPRKHDTILFYAKSDAAPFYRDAVRVPYTRITGTGRSSYASANREEHELRAMEEEYAKRGKVPEDYWTDIGAGSHIPRDERTGYPTQKPLKLYERIIKASSNPGDLVLDPFCGCATTPVAAERLGRQWVGMDIWEGAHGLVLDRLTKETQLSMAWDAEITYADTPPRRTDADEIPVPDLRLHIQRPREAWEQLTNREIRFVLEESQALDGLIGCAGCGRKMEPEFMELDHIQPKAENGQDHILNRILLCRPCNGRKSDQLTMAGLRRENTIAGWMRDRSVAEQMQQRALIQSSKVRDHWETERGRIRS